MVVGCSSVHFISCQCHTSSVFTKYSTNRKMLFFIATIRIVTSISNHEFPFFILQKNASFHTFEAMPIDCVLASTVVFNKTPLAKCKFLGLYLFDCCRACNAVYDKCMAKVGSFNGGPENCYRHSYKCMCKCLDKNTPPEISPFP